MKEGAVRIFDEEQSSQGRFSTTANGELHIIRLDGSGNWTLRWREPWLDGRDQSGGKVRFRRRAFALKAKAPSGGRRSHASRERIAQPNLLPPRSKIRNLPDYRICFVKPCSVDLPRGFNPMKKRLLSFWRKTGRASLISRRNGTGLRLLIGNRAISLLTPLSAVVSSHPN